MRRPRSPGIFIATIAAAFFLAGCAGIGPGPVATVSDTTPGSVSEMPGRLPLPDRVPNRDPPVPTQPALGRRPRRPGPGISSRPAPSAGSRAGTRRPRHPDPHPEPMRKPPLGGPTSPNRRRYARYRPRTGCTASGLRGFLRRGLVGPGGRPVGRAVGRGPGSGPGGQWRDRHRDGAPARPPPDRSARRPKPLQCRGKRTPGLRLGASGAAHRHPRGKPLRLRVADGWAVRGPVRWGPARGLGSAAGDSTAFGAGCDGAAFGPESENMRAPPEGRDERQLPSRRVDRREETTGDCVQASDPPRANVGCSFASFN